MGRPKNNKQIEIDFDKEEVGNVEHSTLILKTKKPKKKKATTKGVEEDYNTTSPIEEVGRWSYTSSFYNKPFKVSRRLIRKGLYTEKDILDYVDSSPRFMSSDGAKSEVFGADLVGFLFSLWKSYPNPSELFMAIRTNTCIQTQKIYSDLVSVSMEMAEFDTVDGNKDLVIGMGFIIACVDGPATFIINTTRSELLKRG